MIIPQLIEIKLTSAQIFPTIEMVSTGYNPRKVSAPRRIASLPEPHDRKKGQSQASCLVHIILMSAIQQ